MFTLYGKEYEDGRYETKLYVGLMPIDYGVREFNAETARAFFGDNCDRHFDSCHALYGYPDPDLDKKGWKIKKV